MIEGLKQKYLKSLGFLLFVNFSLSLLGKDKQRPNILLILADDLGYGDVQCYNPDSKIPTPHCNRLAKEGMLFTDAHSPSTVCTPTRYSILTGRMAFRLNYKGVFTGVGGPCLITPDRLTLPGMLREKGYETAMFGKWHVGITAFDKDGVPIHENGLEAVKRIDYSRPLRGGPVDRGFNHFFGTISCPTTDWLYAYVEGDRIPVPPTQIIDRGPLPKHPYSRDNRPGMIAPDFDVEEVDMVFLEKSLKFLDEHKKQKPEIPFFLFHSLQAVHLPSFPGKDFKGKTDAGPHGDFIFQFDHVVGALLTKLKKLKIADNTLVIVTSDNGPEVPTVINMRKTHNHDGARPWRGVKRDNWEGGHRVPFLVRWPETVKPGSISDQIICQTDIMATCASLVGYDLPEGSAEDSFDLSPVFSDNVDKPVRPYVLHQTISLALAIREGNWKYLDHKGSGGSNYNRGGEWGLKQYALPEKAPNAPGQLYNLKSDPGEKDNLYFKRPEIVKRLKNILEESQKAGRSRP
jgi:arylsulfatase A